MEKSFPDIVNVSIMEHGRNYNVYGIDTNNQTMKKKELFRHLRKKNKNRKKKKKNTNVKKKKMSPKNGTNSTYLSIPLNDLVSTFSSDFQNDVSNIDWSILANSTPALQTQYNLWLGQAGVTAGAHYDGSKYVIYNI